MNNSLTEIYSKHHKSSRERGFSIMKEERGKIIRSVVGSNKKVLDIGCRDGALTQYFSDNNQVLGVDIDDAALGVAKISLGIETAVVDLNGDWDELSGRKFDVVVAGEVLEHLYYPDLVTQKVVGLLLPKSGIFIGSVPNAFSLKNRVRLLFGRKRYTPLGDPTHINHFHVEELRKILSKHFGNVQIIGLGRFKRLAKMFPGLFAFDLFFIARNGVVVK